MLFRKNISEIIYRHEMLDKALKEDAVIRDIHRLYTSINEKSAALFGHVSLMIAACTFLASAAHPAVKPVFLVETFAYLIIALMVLPVLNLSMYDAPIDAAESRAYFARSIRRRALFHILSLYITIILTGLVLITLAVALYYSAKAI